MVERRAAGNIPAELSSFVGRRGELSEVRRMVAESRLVTLTGVAGVGKTRLALRVARLHGHTLRDGVCLVELDHIRDQSLVADAIAGSLGVPEHSGRAAEQALALFVAKREMLLVVDNCEHLTDTVTGLLDELLRQAPGLHVLATSREVLGVPGEVTYRVDPLPLPHDGDDASVAVEVSPALALFIERAAAAVPNFDLAKVDLQVVVEICRRLDGIPLALELAAAQLRVMSPAQLAERLDDRFRLLTGRRGAVQPRHRTLRAAVEWSYELCDKLERLLWERLSVFAGDFDLTDAEAVCADDALARVDVVEAMRGLVDKSILSARVETAGTRFRLLDTLRRYGLDRLRENGPDGRDARCGELELRLRLLDWYAELSSEFEAEWFGSGQRAWLTRMQAELPDIRAALGFAVEHPEHVRTALRMAAALRWFWGATTALREGHGWLARLLEVGPEPSRERARALSALARLMVEIGSPEGGVDVALKALDLARSKDPERLPRVLGTMGLMLLPHANSEALPFLEESVALCRERGQRGEELAYSTAALAQGLALTGQREAAESLFAESIELCREAGDACWQGVVRSIAAFVALTNGDLEGSKINAIEGLRVSRLVPDLHACALDLNIVALVLVGRDDHLAASLLGTVDRHWTDAGGSVLQAPTWAAFVEASRARCEETLGEEEFEAAYRAGQRESLEDAVAQALGEQPRSAESSSHATRQPFGLTRREHDVATLVAEGLTNREIAARLVISPRTAEAHVQNMLIKTGFATRIQLAVWYKAQAEL